MHVERITSGDQVIKYWDLFREGLRVITKLACERVTDDEYCKLLINLASRGDEAWLGIAHQGGPLSYGVAVDSTPPHCARRTFTVSSFYAVPGRPDATVCLMNAFEDWARTHNVESYIVTTRRNTGAAIKCFRSSRYGFRQAYIAFEKHLPCH